MRNADPSSPFYLTGLGTLNHLARFTPSGMALGTSLATDNGSTFAVTTPTDGAYLGVVQTMLAGNALDTGGNWIVQAGSGLTNTGGYARIQGAGSVDGGHVEFIAGDGNEAGADGGGISFAAGAGKGSGGGCAFYAGGGLGSAPGGNFQAQAGPGGPSGGNGGAVLFVAGNAMGGNADGGQLRFNAGAGNGSGAHGKLRFSTGGNMFYGDFVFTGLAADRTFTFPDATGTIALTSSLPVGANPTASVGLTAVNGVATTFLRSDGAPALDVGIVPTWTGVHTFSAQDVHNAGVSLGTSGVLTSNVADAANVTGILVDAPNLSNAIGTDTRATFGVKVLDTAGSPAAFYPFQVIGSGAVVFGAAVKGSPATLNALISVQTHHPTNTNIHGAFQLVTSSTPAGTGTAVGNYGSSNFGAWFRSPKNTSAVANVGGAFECGALAQNSGTTWNDWFAAYFRAWSSVGTSGVASSVLTRAGGIYIDTGVGSGLPSSNQLTITELIQLYIKSGKSNTRPTITTGYGIKIDQQTYSNATGVTAPVIYGIWLANATAGYKALAFGHADSYISGVSGSMEFNASSFNVVFYDGDVVSYDDDMVTY